MPALPLPLQLYQGLTAYSAPLLRRLLARRLANGKETRDRVAEKRGETERPRPAGGLVWIHAVSVGETMSILPVIAQLLARDRALHILLTTSTLTSARLVAERVQDARLIHQFAPIDHPKWVMQFLDHWRPDLGLIVESEFWPNLLLGAEARRIPLVLLNARLSQKSYLAWVRAPASIARLLSVFSLCLAQDRVTAERLHALNAPHVQSFGNLKFAGSPLPDQPELAEALTRTLGRRPRWLAASIHPGEDAFIADAHLALRERLPGLVTIVVPRHPERGSAIAETFTAKGLTTRRRAAGDLPITPCDIYVADTLGELGTYCRRAPVVLMGGSLIPHGGQNPLEPARLGCAVLAGPYTDNFAEIYRQLESADALTRVADAHGLAEGVAQLLTQTERWADQSRRAKQIATAAADVLPQVIAALSPFLPSSTGKRDAPA